MRVRDIGQALYSGPENKLLAGWYDQQRAIIMPIQRQPGANVIATVDRVKAMLPQLEASIPPAIKVSILSDRTPDRSAPRSATCSSACCSASGWSSW